MIYNLLDHNHGNQMTSQDSVQVQCLPITIPLGVLVLGENILNLSIDLWPVVHRWHSLVGSYYVTWGARADASAPSAVPGAPLPTHGKPLGKLDSDDLNTVIEKGLLQYSEWSNTSPVGLCLVVVTQDKTQTTYIIMHGLGVTILRGGNKSLQWRHL